MDYGSFALCVRIPVAARLSKQQSFERAFKTQERDITRHICDVQT
jgi:hypothetical protein